DAGGQRALANGVDALALLGHELRVPLAAILNGVTALESLRALPTAARPWGALVRRTVVRAERLVEDVLDGARAAHGKLPLRRETVHVHHLLEDVLATFQ